MPLWLPYVSNPIIQVTFVRNDKSTCIVQFSPDKSVELLLHFAMSREQRGPPRSRNQKVNPALRYSMRWSFLEGLLIGEGTRRSLGKCSGLSLFAFLGPKTRVNTTNLSMLPRIRLAMQWLESTLVSRVRHSEKLAPLKPPFPDLPYAVPPLSENVWLNGWKSSGIQSGVNWIPKILTAKTPSQETYSGRFLLFSCARRSTRSLQLRKVEERRKLEDHPRLPR